MNEFVVVNLMVILFRTVMIALGFGFAVLGYKLFVKGVYEKAGDLKAAWGDKNLVLKQAAPGTFFAFFGVAVIAISIIRGTGLEISEIQYSPQITKSTQQNPIAIEILTEIRDSIQANKKIPKYPYIKELLEEESIQIEGSWDKAQHELAVLHNIRAQWQLAGIPKESFISMFQEVLVPILKKEAGAERCKYIGNIKHYLADTLSGRPIKKEKTKKIQPNKAQSNTVIRRYGKQGLGE